MKMRPADFDALHDAIRDSFSTDVKPFADYREGYRAAGRSDKHFRWDCLHFSGFNVRPLYSYLNDSHIDTALRRIVNLLDCNSQKDEVDLIR